MTFLSSFLISYKLNQILLIPTFVVLIFGGFITNYIYKNYNKRELIKAQNWNTIILHAIYCILLILTLLII